MSPEQRQKHSERMKKMWAEKKKENLSAGAPLAEATMEELTPEPQMLPPVEVKPETEVVGEQSVDTLKAQIEQLKANQELMMLLLKQNGTQGGANLSSTGKVLGEVEKYNINPDRYPDPTIRLRKEPRLAPLAFDYNYELDYQVAVSNYETKAGVNMKEPKFLVSLNRIVLDDSGNQTNKRYVARRMVFHEDPQAAIVIARENGIDLDDYKDMDNTDTNQQVFLNEMRYLRVRDWLFDIFWPRPVSLPSKMQEEVIGGQLVQVFTKSSEGESEIDFSKIDTKLR